MASELFEKKGNNANDITPMELKTMIDGKGDFILVDVREEWENKLCKIGGSKLIPLGHLQSRISELDPSKQIILHCHHGGRSMQALKYLQSIGFKKLKNLKGGIDAWVEEVETDMERY